MTDLHEQWMDEPGPTDVLAFPMDELRPPASARPAASDADRPTGAARRRRALPGVAAKQAAQGRARLEDELHLLCTHGILHLLGYDHAEPDEEREMFGLQASCSRPGALRADR